ncbi:uncharacterized protein LOC142301144 isoform X5 [Anomaloglossus baeobatrachus]|uniref:uncharacterized protein LOC142301144 isoform X5 n=1 Tax=Anomaloglossus baeobatrachus TaxID=238106 RepID=UPI003F4FA03E
MDVCPGWIICLILSITGLVAPVAQVTVSLNGTVVLPCKYTAETTTMCWGRGACPKSKCSDEIISTDGQRVTKRKSDRYHILGNISQGDVSLTITRVTKEDEGTYCCRVEIHGPFNDEKTEVELRIQDGGGGPFSVTTASTDHHSVTTEDNMFSTTDNPPITEPENEGPVSTTARTTMIDTIDMSNNPSTFTTERTSSTLKETQTTVKSTSITTSVIVGVFGAIFLITLTGVIIYIYKYRKWKNTKTESEMSVINIEALEGTGNEATENIYT